MLMKEYIQTNVFSHAKRGGDVFHVLVRPTLYTQVHWWWTDTRSRIGMAVFKYWKITGLRCLYRAITSTLNHESIWYNTRKRIPNTWLLSALSPTRWMFIYPACFCALSSFCCLARLSLFVVIKAIITHFEFWLLLARYLFKFIVSNWDKWYWL